MRFKNRQSHFDNGASVAIRAERGAVFHDRVDEVAAGTLVSGDEGLDVGNGLWLVDPSARDRDPLLRIGGRTEGAPLIILGERLGVGAEIDHALGADELQPESGFPLSGTGDGVEEDGDAFFRLEARVDFIPGEGSDAFGAFLHIARHHRAALLQDRRGDIASFSGEVAGEI